MSPTGDVFIPGPVLNKSAFSAILKYLKNVLILIEDELSEKELL